MSQKEFDKEPSINNRKNIKTEKITKLKMHDQTKGITKKMHQKRIMSETKRGLARKSNMKTKNH
jgi:hypothetical protein